MPPTSDWPHAPRKVVMAAIIPWNERLGVSYSHSDSAAETGPIGPEDWPVIRALEGVGKISFTSKRIRERSTKLRNEQISEDICEKLARGIAFNR
jgi:hypothetical protein